jgi:predicted HAD superfamily Cof-like phosphohydrolase
MINKVREFQKIGLQKVNDKPTVNDFKDCSLRFELAREENMEYISACYDGNKVEILDALVDQMYVLLGTINFHGMQDIFEEAFNRVHENNMTKFPNGKVLRNPDGKILKPEGFKAVDLKDLITA